jgi:hypothetical protein
MSKYLSRSFPLALLRFNFHHHVCSICGPAYRRYCPSDGSEVPDPGLHRAILGDLIFEMSAKGQNVIYSPFSSFDEYKAHPRFTAIPFLAP